MTHPNSKFKPFEIALPNSGILTGISFIPSVGTYATIHHRPLIIMIHGGQCNAHHFDVDENHTAALTAEALSIPVVSINRPGYGGTFSLGTIPEGSSFHRETGKWEHQLLFPALWETFGIPNRCSTVVIMSHSMGTPGSIVAASLHCQDQNPSYPLAGLIWSGWGTRLHQENLNERMKWQKEDILQNKARMMLGSSLLKTHDKVVEQYMAVQTELAPTEEIQEVVNGVWNSYWTVYAEKIDIPIMYSLGEHDFYWIGNQDHVDEIRASFARCPRLDGTVVRGAPHALEWSHYSRGWYARAMGFALEAAKWHELHIIGA